MNDLHALIQYYRAIGSWYMAECLEKILKEIYPPTQNETPKPKVAA